MRGRLIELLLKVAEEKDCPQPHEIAEYLLANGVIVPPCKVGDTVYVISESRISEGKVTDISVSLDIDILIEITCDYNCEGCPFSCWSENYGGDYSCCGEYGLSMVQDKDFGKTVFLTKEEAEQALKGGAE